MAAEQLVSATAFGVPWYVHPAADPAAWDELLTLAPMLGFVVVNVNDGPGGVDDPYYPAALAPLAGIDLVGYVDLAYGDRPVAEVFADVGRWMTMAGAPVRGIMFDQVPSGGRALVHLNGLAAAARRAGAAMVIANPGVVPQPDLLEIFDVTCVFEGDAQAYAAFRPPPWLREVPPARVWHLVHSCPADEVLATLEGTADRGAGLAWVTDGVLPNPWDHLPGGLRVAL
jgi:hypothetical protein